MDIIYQKEKPLFQEILWKRAVYTYGTGAGNLLIVAGSGLESKEALLTAESAFQSGTGVLTLAFPLSLEKNYRDFIPKEMLLPLPETPSRSLSVKAKQALKEFSVGSKVTILGPGLSKNSETSQLIWELIFSLEGNIIVSGDAIRTLNMGLKLIFDKEGETGIKNYINEANGKICVILSEEELNKLNFKKDKLSLDELVVNISESLNILLVVTSKNYIYFSFNSQLIATKIEDTNPIGEISALSGVLGSFLSQNLDNKKEAVATAIYIFVKGLELSIKTQKSLPSQIKEAIKKEE